MSPLGWAAATWTPEGERGRRGCPPTAYCASEAVFDVRAAMGTAQRPIWSNESELAHDSDVRSACRARCDAEASCVGYFESIESPVSCYLIPHTRHPSEMAAGTYTTRLKQCAVAPLGDGVSPRNGSVGRCGRVDRLGLRADDCALRLPSACELKFPMPPSPPPSPPQPP
eukprot:2454398-Pleurochrysis_carterae.AAC.1